MRGVRGRLNAMNPNRDREPEPVSYKPTCMAWVVEIFASQDKSNCKRYILRGSVCKVHELYYSCIYVQ